MANYEHITMLKPGPAAWNAWRAAHPEIRPDLSGANLTGAKLFEELSPSDDIRIPTPREATAMVVGAVYAGLNLYHADLRGAVLNGANLRQAMMYYADLTGAHLSGAYLGFARCGGARFDKAILNNANLRGANLMRATFRGAHLCSADLSEASLVATDLSGADLTGARVYGIAAWDLNTRLAKQEDLIITPWNTSEVRVDDLKIAQFVYLLLNNAEIRNVIDTIGAKGVLILGRFTDERKAVLDGIRTRLRELGFVPMMFDFEKPTERDFTETIKILAGLSRFIVADITNPKSSLLELQATMPDYMVPFVPIIHDAEEPFAMFRDLKQKYGDWVLDVLEYDSVPNLLEGLEDAVVRPALQKSEQLRLRKTEALKKRHVRDFIEPR